MTDGQDGKGAHSTEELREKIQANEEIINNLKEFFSTYLSEFLKAYRSQENKGEKMDSLLQSQDRIYSKMQDLMKKLEQQDGNKNNSESNESQPSADILKDTIQRQERFITIIKEFFTVNSRFMKVYRSMPADWDNQMEKLLDEQDKVCSKLEELVLK